MAMENEEFVFRPYCATNLEDNLQESMICSICYNPFGQSEENLNHDAITWMCGHTYCYSCSRGMVECPTRCNGGIMGLGKNFLLHSIFDKVPRYCRYTITFLEEGENFFKRSSGCNFQAKEEFLVNIHEKECDFRPVVCEYCEEEYVYFRGFEQHNLEHGRRCVHCGESFSMCLVNDHESTKCLSRPVKCNMKAQLYPFSPCEWEGPFYAIEEHLTKECPYADVFCPVEGCALSIRPARQCGGVLPLLRYQLEAHMKSEVEKHSKILEKSNESVTKKMESLEEELSKLQKRKMDNDRVFEGQVKKYQKK